MTDTVYSKNETNKRLSHLMREAADYGIYRARPFVSHLYEKGYTYQDIANIIHSTRQAVEHTWPKGGK